VPPPALERVQRDMFAKLGANQADPDSWYKAVAAGGQYQMYGSQGQWDVISVAVGGRVEVT
jgi:hypothetical protein